MTEQERKEEWDAKMRKIDAEIANLNAATAKLISENQHATTATIITESQHTSKISKIDAEIANLNAATAKLVSENQWYRLVVGSGVTLAIVAVVKLFL